MSGIPESVDLGPFTYTVAVDQVEIDRRGHENHSTLMGHTDPRALRIVVDPELADGQKRDTLLHEVLHACISSTSLQDPAGGFLSKYQEEALVSALSPLLLDALRRNPTFVDYLTGQ